MSAIRASRRFILRAALALGAVLVGAGAAFAQAFPTKPITIVVPFPPGGGADVTARVVASEMAQWTKVARDAGA